MTAPTTQTDPPMTARLADDEIESGVVAFLADLPTAGALGPIDRSTPLLTSGLLDSLGVLELTEFLSTRFDVAIEDEDFVSANFATLGDLVALVARRRAGR